MLNAVVRKKEEGRRKKEEGRILIVAHF